MEVESPIEVDAAEIIEEWFENVALEDVRKVILSKANYAAALALVSYTEVLGGLKTGKLGIKEKTKENFNAGLALMEWNEQPTYYSGFKVELRSETTPASEIGELLGIYEIFRCGLVHEYFIKGFGFVHNNPDSVNHCRPEDQGIGWHGDKLRFHTNAYLRDLKEAAERFRADVSGDSGQAAIVMEAFQRLKNRTLRLYTAP